jgi:Rieske Fe-S protein
MTERVNDIVMDSATVTANDSATYGSSSETPSTWSRRRLIAMGSFGAIGAVGLAACGSSSGGDSSSGTSSTGGSEGSTGSTGSAATAGASSGTKLAKLSDVPVGQAIVLDAGGQKILLAQPTEGKAVAFSAICTHQGCTVTGGGKCPCHGSVFDIATGAVKNGPATKSLPAVAVSVNDSGEVVLGD